MNVAPIRRDAVQLVRCARSGNPQLRRTILADYGIGEFDHPIIDLVVHLAYFVHELTEDNLKPDSTWLDIRYRNLICGPYGDAHMFVQSAFNGDWTEFWEHVHDYTDGLPEDVGRHGRRGVDELLWELAYLGNTVQRTVPEAYDNWPEDFFQAHFELDLGVDDDEL